MSNVQQQVAVAGEVSLTRLTFVVFLEFCFVEGGCTLLDCLVAVVRNDGVGVRLSRLASPNICACSDFQLPPGC